MNAQNPPSSPPHTERMFDTLSADETADLGRRLGALLEPGDVLALVGPLGAGKTRLTQGLALGLGAAQHATSPSFKLVNEYAGRIRLYHVDAYRLVGPEDLVALGCDELFDGDGAAVVEWADRVEAALPADHLRLLFEITGADSRRITLAPRGPRAARLIARLTFPVQNRAVT